MRTNLTVTTKPQKANNQNRALAMAAKAIPPCEDGDAWNIVPSPNHQTVTPGSTNLPKGSRTIEGTILLDSRMTTIAKLATASSGAAMTYHTRVTDPRTRATTNHRQKHQQASSVGDHDRGISRQNRRSELVWPCHDQPPDDHSRLHEHVQCRPVQGHDLRAWEQGQGNDAGDSHHPRSEAEQLQCLLVHG